MKTVIQVKLTPTPAQAVALRATLDAVNAAASWVSAVAFTQRVVGEYGLRQLTHTALQVSGLGAKAAQHVIKKVVDAYASLRANIRAGNLGEPGSARR